ncbi:MAG: hypothetical protein U0136_08100 [Bdellovibrionota bacterium]
MTNLHRHFARGTLTLLACICITSTNSFADEPENTWQGEWVSPTPGDGHDRTGVTIKNCSGDGHCTFEAFSIQSGGTSCLRQGRINNASSATETATAILEESGSSNGPCTLSVKRQGDKLLVSRGPSSDVACNMGSCTPIEADEERQYDLQSRQNYLRNGWSYGQCYSMTTKAGRVWCTDPELQALLEKATQVPYVNVDYSWHHSSDILNQCEAASDVKRCLLDAYQQKLSELEAESQSRVQSYGQPGDRSEAKILLKQLGGVYKRRFKNGTIDGNSYQSEDVFEIVPVSDDAAYIKLHFEFYNGHTCSLAGIVEYKKVGGFVFQDPDAENSCLLTISLKNKSVVLDDPNGSCKEKSCGARGGYQGEDFKLSERRDIRYMPVILKSVDYQAALKRYNERHPVEK